MNSLIMWSSLRKFTWNALIKQTELIVLSKRTTFVFRRINEDRLSTPGPSPPIKLSRDHFIYEVENTDHRKSPLVDLVLLKDVPGVGMVGEKISVNSYIGYRDLVVVGLAAYVGSEEAKTVQKPATTQSFSSKYSKIVEQYLHNKPLPVILNGQNEWILEPVHIKLALRLKGLFVNEDCIKLPDKTLKGPNSDFENKDFVVKLIMNKCDEFFVRCRIYQCTTTKLTGKEENLLSLPSELLFPEEKEKIDKLWHNEQEVKKLQKVLATSKYKKRKLHKNHKYDKKKRY